MNDLTAKPRVKKRFVRSFGFCSVVLLGVAILVGIYGFTEQGCLDRMFVD